MRPADGCPHKSSTSVAVKIVHTSVLGKAHEDGLLEGDAIDGATGAAILDHVCGVRELRARAEN